MSSSFGKDPINSNKISVDTFWETTTEEMFLKAISEEPDEIRYIEPIENISEVSDGCTLKLTKVGRIAVVEITPGRLAIGPAAEAIFDFVGRKLTSDSNRIDGYKGCLLVVAPGVLGGGQKLMEGLPQAKDHMERKGLHKSKVGPTFFAGSNNFFTILGKMLGMMKSIEMRANEIDEESIRQAKLEGFRVLRSEHTK